MEIVRVQSAPNGKDMLITVRVDDPESAQRLIEAVKAGMLGRADVEQVRPIPATSKWASKKQKVPRTPSEQHDPRSRD
jgi:hypothetical protein